MNWMMHRHQGVPPGRSMMNGGGGGGDTTSTSIQYSPEEAARRTQVMDEAQRIYKQSAPQMTGAAYPGATPVGVSADTLKGQELTRQGASTVIGSIGQTQQASADAAGALRQNQALGGLQNAQMAQGVNYGLNGAMDVQNNPYLQGAMQSAIRPVTDAYTDAGGVMSTIRTNAGQAGQVGSSRQGIAEGIAAKGYLNKVGDITAQMGTQAYDTGQKTFTSTLGQVPTWQKSSLEQANAQNEYLKNQGSALQQVTSAAQAPGAMYSGVGAQNENIQKEYADYAANQRMWGLNAPWIPLQNYASLVYGGSAPSTQIASSQSGSRNALGQVVGAGLTAASMYNMMGA